MKTLIAVISGLMASMLGAASTFNIPTSKRDLVVDYANKAHLLDLYCGTEGTRVPQVSAFFLCESEKSVALIADTTFYDRSGFSWCIVQVGNDGKIGENFNTGGDAHLWCREFELFTASFEGGVSRFIALNAEADVVEGEGVKKSYHGDVAIGTDGHLGRMVSAYDIDVAVCTPEFQRLERSRPVVYAGLDMKQIPQDESRAISAKDNLPNGGLVVPANFKAFACQYRESLKRRIGVMGTVTVYAVFFDADLDGDADCYVSSDAETADGGRYRWTLFLNDMNSFREAKDRIWRNRGSIHDVAMLEPEDVAPKHAFYRVARTYGSPQILVMESDGKRIHTHAYTHLLSDEDRKRCPSQDPELRRNGKCCFDDWEGEMHGKYGFVPPKDFRDQISWLFFHHLERLPCFEYPDEDHSNDVVMKAVVE